MTFSSCDKRGPAKLTGPSAEGDASPAVSSSGALATSGTAVPPTYSGAKGDSAGPNAAAAVPEVCSQFVTEQRELAARWPEATYVPPVLGRCYPTRGGAWTIAFDSMRAMPDTQGVTAHFVVVHLSHGDAGIARAAGPSEPSPFAGQAGAPALRAPSNYALAVGDYHTDVFAPTLFDYDDDGEAELIFTMQAYVNEGTAAGSIGRVLTFKAGAVKPYPVVPNLHWSNVEDIDKDGRPDLTGLYLNVSVAAHSLPDASFSANDAVAQAFAKRACPRGRDAVFLPVPDDAGLPAGYGPTGWNGACARLWGASSEDVIREIDKHCGGSAKPRCESKSVVTNAIVESAETYRRDARVPPPVVLDKVGP